MADFKTLEVTCKKTGERILIKDFRFNSGLHKDAKIILTPEEIIAQAVAAEGFAVDPNIAVLQSTGNFPMSGIATVAPLKAPAITVDAAVLMDDQMEPVGTVVLEGDSTGTIAYTPGEDIAEIRHTDEKYETGKSFKTEAALKAFYTRHAKTLDAPKNENIAT